MRQFLIKYYQFIFNRNFIEIIIFIPLFILLINLNLPKWIIITGTVFLYVLLLKFTVQVGLFVQRKTDNAIFTVCPRCGYANIKLVEICQNCDYQRGSVVNIQTDTKELLNEEKRDVDQYVKNGLQKTIPLPIIINLSLLDDEVVLISVKKPSWSLNTITRNGNRLVINKFDGRCILNWLIVTNKRVCFYAEMFGGWRLGYSHPYNDIIKVSTENKIMHSFFLDNVDKMTIKTTDAIYQLRGANPKKLFDEVNANLRKYSAIA